MKSPQTSPSTGPTRRAVLKGAAWSVPVIAAAVAVPARAASGTQESVGSLVESSDNIGDTQLAASSSRIEACFPDNDFRNMPFLLTATVSYSGDGDFSLAASSVTSSGGTWSIVSATATEVVLVSSQSVSCFAGITGFELRYNVPGTVPELNSVHLNISGESTDGTLRIDGLVSAVHGYGPVIGPRVHDVQ